MDTIVQLATILSPIIAVVIAIWAIRSSAKDTAKKIAALEDNTPKQIDSIKNLIKQQIESDIKQVEMEAEKSILYAKHAKEECEEMKRINDSPFATQTVWKNLQIKSFEERKPERDYKLYKSLIVQLEEVKSDLQDKLKMLK